jgi:hypothetical protein
LNGLSSGSGPRSFIASDELDDEELEELDSPELPASFNGEAPPKSLPEPAAGASGACPGYGNLFDAGCDGSTELPPAPWPGEPCGWLPAAPFDESVPELDPDVDPG